MNRCDPPAFPAADGADFVFPEPGAAAPEPSTPTAAAPAVPATPSGGIDLTDFFASLAKPAETSVPPRPTPAPAAPAEPSAPRVSTGRAFEIDFGGAVEQPKPVAPSSPAPAHGPTFEAPKPFSIDLSAFEKPADADDEEPAAIELDLSASGRSRAPLNFDFAAGRVDDQEEDDAGLLDGLSFSPDLDASRYSSSSHRAVKDDDEDEGKTIEL